MINNQNPKKKIENILIGFRWFLIILVIIWPFYQWPIECVVFIAIIYILSLLIASQNTMLNMIALEKRF